jgi:LuxR family transcriptional regulator, maltose regulon positive regulatory protein
MATHTAEVVDESRDASILKGNARRLRLQPPRLRREVVKRKRLLRRLSECREQRVVLICASPGYGKTILATQLSRSDPRPSCWIHLEDADNDPVVLLRDVVRMLWGPISIAPRIRDELDSPMPRIEEVVLPLLEEQLAGSNPLLLLLDDVELVWHPDSLAILSFLVAHAPPGSQLVLVTRSEPEISLGRLRAAGEVFDLRASDLALDVPETRDLLAAGGIELNDQQVEKIRDRSEGWAAGVALALLSPKGRALARDLPEAAIDSSQDVAAYLLEEAVECQAPEVQQFLLATSVLRQMSPALCDAALEITNSAQLLAALARESLFVAQLDGDGEWYRYNDLFHEVLEAEQRRRAPEVVQGVLSRAAAWHEEHGNPGDAFEYAHSCGDLARAGRILLRLGETLIGRGQIETLRRWLARCTPEELSSEPQLALAGAWVAVLSGDAGEGWRLAAVADRGGDLDLPSADGATSLRSSLANLRATVAAEGLSQMLRDAEFVVAAERGAGTRWIMDGWRGVATAHLLSGRPEAAIGAFSEVLVLTRGRPDLNHMAVNCLGYSALAAADAGDWRRARKWAREAHALTTESGLEQVIQSVAPYTAHATVLVHDSLFPQAEKALQHARGMLPMLHALRWFEADISLRCAHMCLDLGDADGALELADLARAGLSHYPDPGILLERLAAVDSRLSSGGELVLTPSELRLIPFLPSHLSLQEIGDRLYLSRATIKTHTDSVYRKLDVSSRFAAVERLEALGLFPLPANPVGSA